MVNQDMLDKLDKLGFGADVDKLESYVASLQDAAGMGEPIVTDRQYDIYFKLLKQLRPDSYVISRNWENEDTEYTNYDELLESSPMYSIRTMREVEDLVEFIQNLSGTYDLIASIKENGHAIRAVYSYGELVSGSTRGRYKKGRDITRHLKAVLPNYVAEWEDIRLVEVRGEMLISESNFEKLGGKLKNRLSAVTSLIRESVSDEELEYLGCICYKVIMSDGGYETLEDMFIALEDNGFNVPEYRVYENINNMNIGSTLGLILDEFTEIADNGLEYASDGIVVAINDVEQFEALGIDGNVCLGNCAIKMGKHWEANIYQSKILDIEFIMGKKYITPKAKIEPVVTENGAEVSTVPLYNIGVMEDLGLVPDSTIYFKFGGETGVTLCDADGVMIGDM